MKNTPLCLLLPAALLAALSAGTVRAQTPDTGRYAWQFPVAGTVDTSASDLVDELRHEVQRILDAGHLAPLYVSTSDQESVGYTVYQEPGRIVTTLAWAYPHLTAAQQTAVRLYVAAEFADARFSPWGVTAGGKNGNTNYPLPRGVGTPREEHPKTKWWYERSDFGNNRPFLHPLYGAWLHGWRTGDWAAVDAAWPAIRSRYNNYADSDEARLYGGMAVHIAIARLAERAGDFATRDAALARLQTRLAAGLDFAAIEQIARGAAGEEWRSPYGSYPNMYDNRMNGTTVRGWPWLNLSPEIGRYLGEAAPALRTAVLTRFDEGRAALPFWWLPKLSYFTRSWTGDEGSGVLSEVMGMMTPIERWVLQADAATLASRLRGSPFGRGDCHWIEALVQAIEAHSPVAWRDVRYPALPLETWRTETFGAEASSPAAQDLADWDGDGRVNLLERALGTNALAADAAPLAFGTVTLGADTFPTFSYSRDKTAWDLNYLVETSTDLATWTSGAEATAGVAILDQGRLEQITERALQTSASGPRRFFRLRVTRAP
ncbi:MAG: hypothetical protein IPL39_01235 [Opitutaceae bacterium]|nr:hypothetical protein [Opitutaceae bacterium]